MLAQDLDNIHLLLVGQSGDGCFDHSTDGSVVNSDETRVVEKCNRAHDELTVHAVSHSTVTGNRVTKVLNLECALETRSEEATERRDERRKSSEHDDVELHRHDAEGAGNRKTLGKEGNRVIARDEDRVGSALKARPDVCAKVVDRADEVLVACNKVGNEDTPENGEEPGAQEAFPCLLGRNLDEGCPSKGDAAKIGPDVVADDHGDGEDEPDEAFENVVDDKVCLPDDEEESHVRPGELGELELVVALLQ